ncbi:MAG: hypothetical protein WBA29_08160 [Xanthobacteraceae bacterium]
MRIDATLKFFSAGIANPSAAQAFPAILTFAGVDSARTSEIARTIVAEVGVAGARRALPPLHQHFLKQDAVFSHLLVYAG